MAENFDLIFGQSASSQYEWNDSDYQNGWGTVGSTPPTAEQFDALQRRNDKKAQELNRALTPLVNQSTASNRQPLAAYALKDIRYYNGLPVGWYLECSTAGTSGSGDITLPTPLVENATITDGTVTWKVRKISSADGMPIGAVIAYGGNGNIPSGYLLCDGSAVSRTMYPDLFAVIGTTWGAGDGSTTFNLPRSEDLVMQGASATSPVGTYKTAGLPNIEGQTYITRVNYGLNSSGAFKNMGEGPHASSYVADGKEAILGFDASQSNVIYGASDTVQPPAACVRYIIKAFDGQTADSALIDITQYANELATKANRQLSNLDTANLACHVVIDSYYDSATGDWWRKYDDGWIEQGGIIQPSASPTITFLQPYNDTKYIVVANYFDTNAPGNASLYDLSTYPNRTATTVQIGRAMSYGKQWYSCGMGANN